MKKTILFIAVLLLTTLTFGQQGINYKAVISDNGNVLQNQSVSVRFSILEGGTTMVYEENHIATTDANGIIIVNIGEGAATSGDFTTINWSQEQYLKVEIDTGSGYTNFGTTAFKSVPYAKFAENGGATEINDLTDAKTTTTSVFLGANSGLSDNGINYNTALGIDALTTNTTGTKNVANGYQSLFSNTEGNDNVANGYQSLYSNITGSYNVANGYQSLYSNTTGIFNVANGFHSLYYNTTGNYNIANGNQSLYSNTEGSSNVANGVRSLYSNTTGNYNVANGYEALYYNTEGNDNVGIGHYSGYFNQTGSGNIFIGYSAGTFEFGSDKLYIENTDSATPLIGGDFATDEVTINGSLAIKDGTEGAGKIFTSDATGKGSWQASSVYATEINDLTDAKTDANSVFLGYNSGINDDGTNYNTALGIEALKTNTTGDFNVANGYEALYSNTEGYRNVAIGSQSLYSNTTGNSNVANGLTALFSNTIGSFNVANGGRSLYYNTEGSSNVANGYQSLYSNTTGSSNVANGYGSLYSNTEGNGNVGIGYHAGFNELGSNKLYIENTASATPLIGGDFATDEVTINGSLAIKDGTEGAGKIFTSDATGKGSWQTSSVYATEINNLTDAKTDATSVFLGFNSGINDGGDNYNVGVGIDALKTNTTGMYNVANGSVSLYNNTTGSSNVANGHKALYSNTTGDRNVANGHNALYFNTEGIHNIANGYEALYSNTTGEYNVANGSVALYSNTTGFDNVANGFGALRYNTTGNGNVANGYDALYSNTTGYKNVANGYYALYSNTTGVSNVANGPSSLYHNTTGNSNVANGPSSLYFNTTGISNVANGSSALFHNITGFSNVANGASALYNNTEGDGNVGIGYKAGYYETGSNKLYIENTDSSTPLIGGDFATDEVTINGTLKTLKTTGSNVLTVESLDSGANIYVKSTGTNNPSTHYYLDNTFKASTGFNVEQSAYYIYQGGNIFFKNGNILPASHITKDLGASGTAWNNVYAHNYVTQGSAAYTDRSVTEELMNHPPMAKKEGDFDAKSNGLYELNPQSLPANLHTDNGLKIDEISTYNYKANYEQQVQINNLKAILITQQKLIEKLTNEMNSLKSKK